MRSYNKSQCILGKVFNASFLWIFLNISSSFFFTTTLLAENIRIVENGHSQAVILIAGDASEAVLNSATLLSRYLYQSTKARIPVHHEYTTSLQPYIAIHIGVTDYVKGLHLPLDTLDDDGFLIIFPDRRTLVITGPTDWGTEFGVYEFLERYVGVRWLFPGPLGEHIPERSILDIPVQEVREEPAFFSRELSGFPNSIQRMWARRNRSHGKAPPTHNLYRLFPPDQYTKTHPEFFPIIDGKRYLPTSHYAYWWQPCFSAPGIVEEAVKNISRYFAEHPDEVWYSLGVNDAGGFCECEVCVARDSGKKNFLGWPDMSDRYFEWANTVVAGVLQEYPDKWFSVLAYSHLAQPPTKVPVHPRIVPFMTYDRMKWIDEHFEQEGHKITELWEKESPVLGWYDYIYGTPYLLPRVYFHHMAEYYRYGYSHGVRAMYAEAYPNWDEGPKLYVALKLQWNPELDVDTLLDDWYVCAVGNDAAPHLAEYYDVWETFWTKRLKISPWLKHRGQWLPFNDPGYLNLVSYDDISFSRQLLEQVLARTKTAKQRARAKLLLRAFEYYEASVVSYLGLVNNLIQPGKSEEYYEHMNKKRRILTHEFKQDPVLIHLRRFDDKTYPHPKW